MPRLKGVDSLQEIANRALLNSLVKCCRKFGEPVAGAWIELREATAAMKEAILDNLPPSLMADFVVSFFNECASSIRNDLHGRFILEMIMDMDIIGLRLTRQMVRFLNPEDAPRLRRLKEVYLCQRDSMNYVGYEKLPLNLEKFHLEHLTSLTYPRHCTDSDLEIVGRCCPNLEILDLHASRSVTDEGMRCMSGCPNLRVVRVDHCPNVTYRALSFLLSAHKKLEEFSYGRLVKELEYRGAYGRDFLYYDMLSGLDFTVESSSLTSFVYEPNLRSCRKVPLKAIVTKFPNLTRLNIKFFRKNELFALKYLDKLEELEVESYSKGLYLNLREALTDIGENLTSLILRGYTLSVDFELEHGILNSVFDCCPNLQILEFGIRKSNGVRFVIPPFQTLKELIVHPQSYYPRADQFPNPILIFGVMLKLEILSLIDFDVGFKLLESMMLDNVKFPNLKVVKTSHVKSEDLAEIEQIAKHNNLDFCIDNKIIIHHCNHNDFHTENNVTPLNRPTNSPLVNAGETFPGLFSDLDVTDLTSPGRLLDSSTSRPNANNGCLESSDCWCRGLI